MLVARFREREGSAQAAWRQLWEGGGRDGEGENKKIIRSGSMRMDLSTLSVRYGTPSQASTSLPDAKAFDASRSRPHLPDLPDLFVLSLSRASRAATRTVRAGPILVPSSAGEDAPQFAHVERLLEALISDAFEKRSRSRRERSAGHEYDAPCELRRRAHHLGVEVHSSHHRHQQIAQDDVVALARGDPRQGLLRVRHDFDLPFLRQ